VRCIQSASYVLNTHGDRTQVTETLLVPSVPAPYVAQQGVPPELPVFATMMPAPEAISPDEGTIGEGGSLSSTALPLMPTLFPTAMPQGEAENGEDKVEGSAKIDADQPIVQDMPGELPLLATATPTPMFTEAEGVIAGNPAPSVTTDNLPTGGGSIQCVIDYSYDALRRVTGATYTEGGTTARQYTFGYDLRGNRTAQTVALNGSTTLNETYSYNPRQSAHAYQRQQPADV
jgi:YD repeat-containing protein